MLACVGALTIVGVACTSDNAGSSTNPSGGSIGRGGSNNGGTVSSGGTTESGGTTGSGGTTSSTGGKVGTGGAPSTGGATASGGDARTGGSMGSGGKPATGGAVGSGGGVGTGGATSKGGTTGAAGGSTGTGGGTGYLPKNDPVPSAGCGKALPSKYKAGADTTFKDMTSAGIKREYIVYIPTGYDSSKPSKLLFAWHCMGSSDTGAVSSGYYGVKQNDTGKNTILVAPQGYTDSMPWRSDDKDVTFFDDMLKLFKSELCIDESRVFSMGFSFGGMMTYSLSVARQADIRAAVGIAPANYNIYVTKTKTHAPIGWMQTTGVNDTTCPWQQSGSSTNGSMYIGIEHGTDNGCTVPNPVPKWTSGNHLCVDFAGCKEGYPTKVCTFNGPHTDTSTEGGVNWIYSDGWKFLAQF
jgi:poly(3-hydroxybutyrate) depolymerase